LSGPVALTVSPAPVSHCLTADTWEAVGANCAAYSACEMKWPYCALLGSLTADASAVSCAALRGASQTLALTCCRADTLPAFGAFVVHEGFVPFR